MIKKRLNIPIYKYVLDLFIGSRTELDKVMEEKIGETMISTTDATTSMAIEGYHAYMFLDKSKLNIGLLVHELSHVANHIFESIGQKPDLMNDETYAYLLQFLVDEVWYTGIPKRYRK